MCTNRLFPIRAWADNIVCLCLYISFNVSGVNADLASMKGNAVLRMVLLRPTHSSSGPPRNPPASADSGIRLPIHEASCSSMVSPLSGIMRDAMAGELHADE